MTKSSELTRRFSADVAARLVAALQRSESGVPISDEDRQALGASLLQDVFADYARECLESDQPVLSPEDEDTLARAVLDELFASGPLQRYLDDASVMEINANGCGQTWVVRTDGTKEPGPPLAATNEGMIELIRQLAAAASSAGLEYRFDASHPRVDFQLPNGARCFALMGVTAAPILAVRCHNFLDLVTLDQLQGVGMLDLAHRELLEAAVQARLNLIVCGGTATGKTTLLRALCNAISPAERLVVIEDSPELGLERFPDAHPDLVTCWQREPNIEGEGEVSIADLTRWVLRANADRVIVGEVRGAEVIPMLSAMALGNAGSMCSVHANSSRAVFSKLATYAVQAPERLPLEATNQLIAAAVDLVIYLELDSRGRGKAARYVSSVREVVGAEGALVVSNEISRPGADGRALAGVPLQPETLSRLEAAGFDAGLLERDAAWAS